MPASIAMMPTLRLLARDADRFAVVDTETTGLYNSDRVIEIGIVTVNLQGEIEDRWETLVQPERDIGAITVHGITASMLTHAPLFQEVAGDIAARLHGACLVGHNFGCFDRRMIANEFDRLTAEYNLGGYLDTRSIWPGKLTDACHRLGLPSLNAHSAMADAEATTHLFLGEHHRFASAGSASFVSVPQRATGRQCRRSPQSDASPAGCADAEVYLRMLDSVLEDGVIDSDERGELAALAEELALTTDEVDAICLEKVSRKIDEVLEDGILTQQEHDELLAVVEQCGVGSDVAQRRIRAYLPHSDATTELHVGDEIVVTGSHPDFTRDEIRAVLEGRGFKTHNSVTKRTKLVLAADVASESGKAKRARTLGITVASLADLGDVRPAEADAVGGVHD